MIEFKGTGFTYDGERFVLDGVDARIERGEFVCILGGNYMAAPITRSFQITK